MMRSLFPFVLFVVSALSVAGAPFNDYVRLGERQISAIVPSDTRTVIDLSGPWQRIVDGQDVGSLTLPSGMQPTDRLQLRKTVRIDAAILDERVWHLHFLGISDEVEIRVNNRIVMRYPGGNVPFSARIPERYLTAGANTIELTLTAPGSGTMLIERNARGARSRQMGILREILLVGTPHAWTNDLRLTVQRSGSSATVGLRATIVGGAIERLVGSAPNDLVQGSTSVAVEAILRGPNGEVVARSTPTTISVEKARESVAAMSLTLANPQLWSPASPTLYTVSVTLAVGGRVIDEFRSSVGIRTIGVTTTDAGRRFILNDSVVTLNVIDYADEYPGLGASMSWKQMEHDVALLKTLGVNAVRVRGGSPHPYFVHLCDRYGLMIFAEIPAVDVPTSLLGIDETTARLKNAAERLTAYVDTHPSVVAIGLGDGLEEGSDGVAAYYAEFVKLIRRRTSRLIYKVVPASLIDVVSEGGFDVIVIDATRPSDHRNLAERIAAARRIIRTAAIVTSFGSRVSPANRNGITDPLSNESQAVVLRDAWRVSMSAGVAGVIVRSFNDHSLERPTMLVDHDDPYVRTMGLVDVWRQPRVAYTMLKSLINDEKEPLLQARDVDEQTPFVFIVTGLVLGLVFVLLINRSRRFREYLLRAIVRPYNFYADIRDQRILSTAQTAILGVVISAGAGLMLAALVHFLRTDSSVEYLLHIIIPNDLTFEVVRYIAWRPALAVPTCSVFVLMVFGVFSLLLRIGAMFVRSRIFFRDTFTIVVWSALPLIVFLPIGIAMYQVLSADAVSIWIPSIAVLVALWFVVRMLRATAVVFDAPAGIVYLVGLGVVALSVTAIFWIWTVRYDALDFVDFFLEVVTAA